MVRVVVEDLGRGGGDGLGVDNGEVDDDVLVCRLIIYFTTKITKKYCTAMC